MNKSGLDKRKMSFGECEDHRRQTSLRNPVGAFVTCIRLLELS